MLSKTVLAIYLAALVEARFGQEQVPIQAISDVQGGDPGVAPTIAGAAISDLLAGANACAKLQRADQIITELGTGADAVAAAIGMVAAEKNFNPFAQDIPTICNDPTLPATEQLRGITPLIDPAVGGADVANALSAQTQGAPLDATGLSVADLLSQNGFSNFTTQDAAGNAGDAPAAAAAADTGAASADAGAADSGAAAADSGAAASNSTAATAAACANGNANANAAANQNSTAAAASSNAGAADTNASGVQASSIAGLDFGLCVPTIKFEGGLGGRPATEFTFQAIDALVAKGQQEALNPNIITNRVCDQLTNVCEANDAAKAACLDAKAQVEALGTRDQTTADAFNDALGFSGAAEAAVARKVRRGGLRRRGSRVHREVMDWTRVRA
ncbi:hypothetical protein GTA08_BOTSDO07878 [Neofusicoccum parvum]|uniref:Uncharacterized protein n=1 Tax=Neofusicoccum parvum TaxID=310453 RepID=A0ACB5S9Z6_9PEZI|nr:hypothetical protein GTA08_BOTSDO07878 [Neofusicoccum parvum]